jgi:sugar phosphate isomerase/epimerase
MKLAYPIATPEVRGKILGIAGPVERVCDELCAAGYKGVEPFLCNPAAFDVEAWARVVEGAGLVVAAVGTGPMVFDDKLSFTAAEPAARATAVERAKTAVRFAARFGAQVNIGKLRGDLPAGNEARAREWIRAAFTEVCACAAEHKVSVTLEPQNRSVVNNLNTTAEALAWLRELRLPNLRLMLDVFHMDVEHEDVGAGIEAAREVLWHVHYADTERRVPGDGRLDFAAFTAKLRAVGYDRFITAEIKQEPDSATAARRTAEYLRPMLQKGERT